MFCQHVNVVCVNEFEMIRKYRCLDCSNVMMCQCDEEYGRKFLSHQLYEATDYVTKERIPVSLGFQPKICHECRGLPPSVVPMAAIVGRTSKIRRYYWREIHRRTTEIYSQWAEANGSDLLLVINPQEKEARKEAEKKALDEIKLLHANSPKYIFRPEESFDQILSRCSVEVINLQAIHSHDQSSKRVKMVSGGDLLSAEEFVQKQFSLEGLASVFCESVPFHVLFGVFFWMLIQDPGDSKNRILCFGDRFAFDDGDTSKEVMCMLPDDFGSPAYALRRKRAIDTHFQRDLGGDLKWLFEYWLEPSERLRQYLWAHRKTDVEKAREILGILPEATVRDILRYLIESYWERFVGWPDLLVFSKSGYFFSEIKSSKDHLSEDQKRWIDDNYRILKLPFKLVKIHNRAMKN